MKRLCLVACLATIAAGCGGTPCRPGPVAPTAAPVAEVRAESPDLFAGVDLRAGAVELEATSLFGAIDADVVHRILRQRLGKVARLVLRDLLAGALSSGHSRAAEDVVDTVASLVLTDADATTRSQRITAAVLRLGVTYAFYAMIEATAFKDHGCADHRITAIYEGLASSTFLGRVGFPAATGNVPKACGKLAAEVARTADTVAAVGLELRSVPALVRRTRAVVKACREGDLILPPIVVAFVGELHELRHDFLRTPIATLERARDITERYAARLETEKLDDLLAGHGPCLRALQSLSARAEASVANLMRLVPEGDETVTLGAVQSQMLAVLANFEHPALTRIEGWLEAYRHLRDGTLDKLMTTLAAGTSAWTDIEARTQALADTRASLAAAVQATIDTRWMLGEIGALRDLVATLDRKTDKDRIKKLEDEIEALEARVAALASALQDIAPIATALGELEAAWNALPPASGAAQVTRAFLVANRYLDMRAIALRALSSPGELVGDLVDSAEAWGDAMACVRGTVSDVPAAVTLDLACAPGSVCHASCGEKVERARAAGLLRLDAVTATTLAVDARDLGQCVRNHGVAVRESLLELATQSTCTGGLCAACGAELGRVKSSLAATGVGSDLLDMLGSLATTHQKLLARFPELALVRSVAAALVSKQKLSAKEITELANALTAGVKAMEHIDARARELVVEVLEAVPQAIKEDEKAAVGVRFDTRVLTTSMLQAFADDQSTGLYLRATVGAGYTSRDASSLSRAAFEELGVGYRVHGPFGPRYLVGVHAMTSGLLLSLVPNDDDGDHVFVGGGVSLNAYKLVEVSLNAGLLRELGADNHLGVLLSLQIPLLDYFNELTTGDVEPPAEDAR